MKVEEEDVKRKERCTITAVLVIAGLISLIMGFVTDSGFLRAMGNLAILAAILLWVYRLFLAKAVDYFQYKSLKKLEDFYERFLKFALRGRKAYVFFFGTFIMLT